MRTLSCHLILASILVNGCGEDTSSPPAPATEQTASISPEVDAVVSSEPLTPAASEARPLAAELQPAAIMIGRNQFDEARSFIESFLEKHPDDGQAVFLLGLTHHKQENYAKARPYFQRSIELAPDFPTIHHFFGYCLYNLGELEAARTQFMLHLRSDPLEADSHFGLGLVLLDDNQLNNAERSFKEAIRLTEDLQQRNPARYRSRQADLAKCHARLADVYLARDEHAAARDALLETIRIYPMHYQAYYKLSLAYRHLGDDALAEQAMADHERVKDRVRP